MSKQDAQQTEYSLRRAEEHLNDATRHAADTGDKSLHQRVIKIRETVTETRKDIIKKLDNHSG